MWQVRCHLPASGSTEGLRDAGTNPGPRALWAHKPRAWGPLRSQTPGPGPSALTSGSGRCCHHPLPLAGRAAPCSTRVLSPSPVSPLASTQLCGLNGECATEQGDCQGPCRPPSVPGHPESRWWPLVPFSPGLTPAREEEVALSGHTPWGQSCVGGCPSLSVSLLLSSGGKSCPSAHAQPAVALALPLAQWPVCSLTTARTLRWTKPPVLLWHGRRPGFPASRPTVPSGGRSAPGQRQVP